MDMGSGVDCVMGGGCMDDVTDGDGHDILLAGPGDDTFSGCEEIYQD